jgi:Uma2 family endonuclease
MVDPHESASAILDVKVMLSDADTIASEEDERRVLLYDVPWSTYIALADSIDSRSARLTYCEGQLEIMTTSDAHEISKKVIARLLELFCLERDIPLFSYGMTTIRKKRKKRGVEPDEWYTRGARKFPPADVAIEVVVSNPLLDKLDVYRKLAVREVWVYHYKRHAFELHALRGDQYESIPASEIFPEVDFSRILHYVREADQHAALKAFRDELRGTP